MKYHHPVDRKVLPSALIHGRPFVAQLQAFQRSSSRCYSGRARRVTADERLDCGSGGTPTDHKIDFGLAQAADQ
jgi:hypothetical protein